MLTAIRRPRSRRCDDLDGCRVGAPANRSSPTWCRASVQIAPARRRPRNRLIQIGESVHRHLRFCVDTSDAVNGWSARGPKLPRLQISWRPLPYDARVRAQFASHLVCRARTDIHDTTCRSLHGIRCFQPRSRQQAVTGLPVCAGNASSRTTMASTSMRAALHQRCTTGLTCVPGTDANLVAYERTGEDFCGLDSPVDLRAIPFTGDDRVRRPRAGAWRRSRTQRMTTSRLQSKSKRCAPNGCPCHHGCASESW